MTRSTPPTHRFIYSSIRRAVSRLVKYGFDDVGLQRLFEACPDGFTAATDTLLAEVTRLPKCPDTQGVRYQLTIQRAGVSK